MERTKIMEDLIYRQNRSKIINKLEEEVIDGIHDENPLIDLVLHYKREIEQLEEEIKTLNALNHDK